MSDKPYTLVEPAAPNTRNLPYQQPPHVWSLLGQQSVNLATLQRIESVAAVGVFPHCYYPDSSVLATYSEEFLLEDFLHGHFEDPEEKRARKAHKERRPAAASTGPAWLQQLLNPESHRSSVNKAAVGSTASKSRRIDAEADEDLKSSTRPERIGLEPWKELDKTLLQSCGVGDGPRLLLRSHSMLLLAKRSPARPRSSSSTTYP